MEYALVIDEISGIVECWCEEQFTFRYCKSRHIPIYNLCTHTLKCLNAYEEHLFVDLISTDILDIINDRYDIANK